MTKILVMGLPGSGKTTFSKVLAKELYASHFEADAIREMFNDWDFTELGRLRQANRMAELCDLSESEYSIADFVCPTRKTRFLFGADIIIWIDTVIQSDYMDTNKIFQKPTNVDYYITSQNAEYWNSIIVNEIREKKLLLWDNKKPTALVVGRFQPFHLGHKTLVLEALERSEQVLIAVRDTHDVDENNPFNYVEVKLGIDKELTEYKNQYKVVKISNIENIFYGRGVGYNIERLHLADKIEKISATEIRKNK